MDDHSLDSLYLTRNYISPNFTHQNIEEHPKIWEKSFVNIGYNIVAWFLSEQNNTKSSMTQSMEITTHL